MEQEWWRTALFYQVFPLSFQGSSGDGKGDIRGIISRLPYLEWLGVDAIWLGPVYRSPMVDSGYDISDFCDIDPVFGTLADFDDLVSQVHARGMKLIVDFVPNHTSVEHPWFKESRASRDNSKRGWYIWRSPRPGNTAPSNWIDNTWQPAWELDPRTGQYYYHRFLRQQPDLNFRNPDVRRAIQDVLRFWLDRGVDGFRLDAAADLLEDELLRDEPREDDAAQQKPPAWKDHIFSTDRPGTIELLAEFRSVVDSYPGRVLLGEVNVTKANFVKYYGLERPALNLPFNFELLNLKNWSASHVSAVIDQYLTQLPPDGCPNWLLGSHDVPRLRQRIGSEHLRGAAVLAFTLPGAVLIYYGDELGLDNAEIPQEAMVDPYAEFGFGRDPQRVPMPWDNSANFGFSTATPYLPCAPEASSRNMEYQKRDQRSLLNLYRKLAELRGNQNVLRHGTYIPGPCYGHLLQFRRELGSHSLNVALNFGPDPISIEGHQGEVVLSTSLERQGETITDGLLLRPFEGLILDQTSNLAGD